MASSTLDIQVKADQALSEVRKMRTELEKLEKQGRNTAQNSKTNFKKIALAAGVAYVAVTALRKAAEALGGAVNTFIEFEQSIANLSAITGATGADLEFLSDAARELGKTTTLSASQVATAFKLVASAKPDLLESTQALKDVTEQTITLAEAAGIDLPTAADALGNALNQFSAGAESASRFVNVLAAGSKFGASSIADLAASLTDAGVVAKGANVSFEQTVAALEVLGSSGIKAQRAGVGLRNVILKLQKEGVDKFNPAVVGLNVALQNLKNEALPATEVMRIFGLETAVAASSLISGAEAVGELTEKVTGTKTAMEQASTNTATLDGAIKELNSAYEEASLTLIEDFAPALKDATVLATAFFLALGSESESDAAKRRFSEIGAEIAVLQAKISGSIDPTYIANRKDNIEMLIEEATGLRGIIALDEAEVRDQIKISLAQQVVKQKELNEAKLKEVEVQKLVTKETNKAAVARREAELIEETQLENIRELEAVVGSLRTPLEGLVQQQEALNTAIEMGNITMEQYDILTGRVGDKMDALKKKGEEAEETINVLNDVAKDFASGAADAFIDFATDSETAFSDFAKSFIKDIAKMIIQAQILKALNSAFPSLGLSGDAGSVSVSPKAKGDAFSQGNVLPFAKGGVVSSPTLFGMAGNSTGLMGEAGPEAIMPLSRGKDGKLGVAGGGTTVNIINNSSGTETKVEESSTGDITVMINDVVNQGLNDGTFDNALNSSFGTNRRAF